MPSLRVVVALFIGASGVALAGGALAGAAWVPPTVATMPGALSFEVAGGVLLFFALILALTARREIAAPDIVPAHVAFTRKTSADDVVPLKVARPVVAVAPKPADPHQDAVTALDVQIRDITKRINRAAVLLATHKLSKDGYTKLVDDLKEKRAALETERVHLELRKHTH